jgi:hypothetical protein
MRRRTLTFCENLSKLADSDKRAQWLKRIVLAEPKSTSSTDLATKPTCRGQARLCALADQTTLELRESAKHVKDQPPLCRRRVEGFGQAAKPDASHPKI